MLGIRLPLRSGRHLRTARVNYAKLPGYKIWAWVVILAITAFIAAYVDLQMTSGHAALSPWS
jgi:hypothetical protein